MYQCKIKIQNLRLNELAVQKKTLDLKMIYLSKLILLPDLETLVHGLKRLVEKSSGKMRKNANISIGRQLTFQLSRNSGLIRHNPCL